MSRLLVVEDDAILLDAMAYNLQGAGHEVLTAADGVKGRDLAKDPALDLIILDVMLPGMSGLDICRLVRVNQVTPIIMLTARDSEQDVIAGLETGADDYMTKPFSMRELKARVAALLRRDQMRNSSAAATTDSRAQLQEPPEVLRTGSLTLDVVRHEVRKNGQIISLGPREFQLLHYLMGRPEQVLSREVILANVWGYLDIGARTVDVHVRWLREKLEDDPSQPRHLVTVRGFGYRFDS